MRFSLIKSVRCFWDTPIAAPEAIRKGVQKVRGMGADKALPIAAGHLNLPGKFGLPCRVEADFRLVQTENGEGKFWGERRVSRSDINRASTVPSETSESQYVPSVKTSFIPIFPRPSSG